MVLVRERGKAMAEAAAATPTGMTAVLGGDRDEVLAALDKHGLTAANDNGPGQIVAAGTLEQLAALAADPPAKARLMPLSVAGAFHTEHMAPAVGTCGGLARSVSAHDPRTPVISNRDGQVVHDGRDVLARIVGQIASPVRWDLCMETMLDLGVTGILEMPPAGTLTGIAKRAMKGVETFALKTPDQLDDARAFVEKHGEASGMDTTRPGGWWSPPPRAPSTSRGDAAGRRHARPRRPDRRGRRRRATGPASWPRTAARSSSGSSTTATWSPPASRWSGCTPKERLMADARRRHRSAARRDPRPRRLPPDPVVPNSEVVEAIDSSDEWIQQRSGIKQRRWATPDETVQMMSVAASRKALERAGIDAAQIDGVIVATVTHLLQTPAVATAIAHELGTERAAAFDISAACAGFCHGIALAADMVRGGSAGHVLVIGVERLSDITDLDDRGTAFIFADGAGAAVVGPSETPGIGPVVWGSDGEQFDLIRQREDWRDVIGTPENPARRDAAPGDAGQRGLPLGVVRDGQDRPAGPRPRRRHRRRPRRVRAPPGQHAHHRRDGPLHEAARARQDRPRHRRPGQHLGGLDPARAPPDDRGGRGAERRHSRC